MIDTQLWWIKWWFKRYGGRLGLWFVWALPVRLVYWCAVRVIVYSTTGEYTGQVVPELRALDALKRWHDDHLA